VRKQGTRQQRIWLAQKTYASVVSNNYIAELKCWSIYFLTAMLGIWIHEIGHCLPAWLNGIAAFPSPANEYILHPVSTDLNQYISLGGYIGTVFLLLQYCWYFFLQISDSSRRYMQELLPLLVCIVH
jgi:hypothetical protein